MYPTLTASFHRLQPVVYRKKELSIPSFSGIFHGYISKTIVCPTLTHLQLCINQSAASLTQANRTIEVLEPEEGFCAAMCDAFSHLFLMNCDLHSPDLEENLVHITKLFEEGAPQEVVLAQRTRHQAKRDFDFLKDRSIEYKSHKVGACLLGDAKNLSETLKALNAGIFRISFRRRYPESGHSVLLIRQSSEINYLFDPNIGLLKVLEGQITPYIESLSLAQRGKIPLPWEIYYTLFPAKLNPMSHETGYYFPYWEIHSILKSEVDHAR